MKHSTPQTSKTHVSCNVDLETWQIISSQSEILYQVLVFSIILLILILYKYNRGLTFTGFPILIQFLPRRTPAVEASNDVTAQSLTSPIGLLTFIHI